MGKTILYVYGTLRPNNKSNVVLLPGDLYDISGAYPGLLLGDVKHPNSVVCERVEVGEDQLRMIDAYEGYHEEDKEHSLYLRVPVLDGFTYVYNQDLSGYKQVMTRMAPPVADWLVYKGINGPGRASYMVEPVSSSSSHRIPSPVPVEERAA